MGNETVPKNVQELAAKAGEQLFKDPSPLPGPVAGAVDDLKKFPGKVGDDLKKSFTGPPKPGDASKADDAHLPAKPNSQIKVDVAPDINPKVEMNNGKPAISGNAGAHVTVTDKNHGNPITGTARGTAGIDAAGTPQAKADLEAGATLHAGGGDGKPKVTVDLKGEAHGTVDKAPAGTRTTESVRGTAKVEADLGHGLKASAGAFAGVDAHQGAGDSGSKANFGVGGGVTFTPGAGDSKAPTPHAPAKDPFPSLSTEALQRQGAHARGEYQAGEVYSGKLSGPTSTPPPPDPPTPAQILAAKLQHDMRLMNDAPSDALKKLAGERAAAEQKVLANHPEWKDALLPSSSIGTNPGDFSVTNKNGVQFQGPALELPPNIQREVQNGMQVQTRGTVADRAPETPGREAAGVGR